jgi:hypothetical protein
MYKLQVASNEFQILRSTILMQLQPHLFIVNAYFFPILPSNRLQILLFSVVFGSLIVWRLFYVRFSIKSLYANRYSYLWK